MPLFFRYKPCPMAYLRICLLAGLMIVASSGYVFAGGAPACGQVDRSLVRSVYAAARRVEYLVDVQATMGAFCASAESLDQWERQTPRAMRDRDYKIARKVLISSAQKDLRVLKGQLISLRGWAVHNSRNNVEEALRLDRIKKARNQVLTSVMKMGGYTGQIYLLKSGRG